MRDLFASSIIFWLAFIVFNIVVGGYSTEYVIETWGTYATQRPVDVSFVLCCLAGLFVAEITVPLAILTLLLSPFFM